MFSRRTISLFVLVALVFGTWTVGGLVLGQKPTLNNTEVSEKPVGGRAETQHTGMYSISGADLKTLASALESRFPNAQLGVDLTGNHLTAHGTLAELQKIADALLKHAPKAREISWMSQENGKSYVVPAETRFRETYSISGADMRLVVNALKSAAPNTEIAVNSERDRLFAIGSKADHEKILEALKKIVPNPVVAGSTPANGTSAPWYTTRSMVGDPDMVELVQADMKMEKEAKKLVVQYRFAAGKKEQGEARTKLEELAKQHFDVRQERRGLELSQLEQRLKRVRASIEAREEDRELIIDRHIAQLLGEGDELAF